MTVFETISISDQSGGDSGWDVIHGQTVAAALTYQLKNHVGPAYRTTPCPVVWAGTGPVAANSWPLYLLKDPDVAGALGYHDVDPQGRPYERIFTSVCKQAHIPISSVVSHEAIETFVDPWANDFADRGDGTSVALEACDPVQNSGYLINGISVSNFVTRAWFDPLTSQGPFDYLGHLKRPLALEKGGYLIVMQDGRISQTFAEEETPGAGYSQYRRLVPASAPPSRFTWRSIRATQ